RVCSVVSRCSRVVASVVRPRVSRQVGDVIARSGPDQARTAEIRPYGSAADPATTGAIARTPPEPLREILSWNDDPGKGGHHLGPASQPVRPGAPDAPGSGWCPTARPDPDRSATERLALTERSCIEPHFQARVTLDLFERSESN